jgi:flagellar protein FliO/FliZ
LNNSALMPLLAFVAVVAMIPLALWLMRRSGLAGSGQAGLLRSVASLSLSPSQRVVVVELGQGPAARWMVLGVSAENITALTTLDGPLQVPDSVVNPHANPVNQLIERWRQNLPGGRDGQA